MQALPPNTPCPASAHAESPGNTPAPAQSPTGSGKRPAHRRSQACLKIDPAWNTSCPSPSVRSKTKHVLNSEAQFTPDFISRPSVTPPVPTTPSPVVSGVDDTHSGPELRTVAQASAFSLDTILTF